MLSILRKLKYKLIDLFDSIPTIGVSKRNFLMISADVRKGTVIVSYKGKVKTGYFSDKTMRHMVQPDKFDKHIGEFLTAAGKLINQVIQ
jgi:hypothetical protein